jgi:predicted GNAT family N-acyltransferase
MEIVELDTIAPGQWDALIGGERQPWGGDAAEGLAWADKERHLAARADSGELVALAGAGIYEVSVAERERFPVVGVGGVFVARRERGAGLASELVGRLLSLAAGMGPERAMLFCRPRLMTLYAQLGFAAIEAPVEAEQPGGLIEVPMPSMWRPLHDGAGWPPGPVRVLGLPF